MPDFTVTITPRISETDLVGHINNASIAVWFEDLRVRYLESLQRADDALPPLALTVASITIDYVSETFYGADVVMKVNSVKIGNTSMTVEGEMYQRERQVVKARAVLVHWDPDTRKPQRISEAYRQRIESG